MKWLIGVLACVAMGAGCGGGGDESGDLIAFTSLRDGTVEEVFVMNADGTEVRQLTDDDGDYDSDPTWSPDGSEIAFDSDREWNIDDYYRDDEVLVMNADGTEVRQLTDNDYDDANPAWSPNGKRIAFEGVSGPDGGANIFVMNTDGTQVRQLTDNDDVWDASPAWSPDSKRIAFMRVDLYEKVEIFVMNADGTEVRQITDNDYVDVYPAWSPDGKRIAFDSDRDGDFEVFVMNPDGTEVRQLTDNDHADGHSVWSPDGSQIAFASDRDTPKIHDGFGTFEIFVMNADGTDVYSTGQEGYSPSWGG